MKRHRESADLGENNYFYSAKLKLIFLKHWLAQQKPPQRSFSLLISVLFLALFYSSVCILQLWKAKWKCFISCHDWLWNQRLKESLCGWEFIPLLGIMFQNPGVMLCFGDIMQYTVMALALISFFISRSCHSKCRFPWHDAARIGFVSDSAKPLDLLKCGCLPTWEIQTSY